MAYGSEPQIPDHVRATILFLVPVSPRQPKAEIKSLWVQTSPQGRSDLGRCEAAFYSVADGVLTMRDENGTPTGKNCRLAPGDDERVIASWLKLESWRSGAGASDFKRAQDCSRHGIA
jgi:hypothetical protein